MWTPFNHTINFDDFGNCENLIMYSDDYCCLSG